MPNIFSATSTTDEVLSGINLHGKRVLVTGVSAGLGVETARSIAAHGAQVIGAARDLKKAEAATNHIQKDASANGGSFELIELDLGNLANGIYIISLYDNSTGMKIRTDKVIKMGN